MDTPNYFIHTHIEYEKVMVIIKIREFLVDIMMEISPYIYGPYFITDCKGVKHIIFQFENTIYGTITKANYITRSSWRV